MIDILKSNAPLLAAALLGWPIWSAVGGKAPSKDDGQRKVPEIAQNDMRLRPDTETFALSSDPCRQGSGKPIGGTQGDANGSAAGGANALDGEKGAGASSSSDVPGKASAPSAGEPAHFTLVLDAVLFAGPSSVAVLNRQALGVGQAIPGFDDKNPPVLEEIGATWVRVQYAGRHQRLDLDGARQIQLERSPEKRGRE